MIASSIILLACQLAGEVLVQALHAPVPGPVAGMLILFVGLTIKGQVPPALDTVTRTLLGNLSLLFVPAGVGIMLHFQLLAQQWLPVCAALLVGTVLAIAVTGLLMHRLSASRDEP
jgi:holin-like protein